MKLRYLTRILALGGAFALVAEPVGAAAAAEQAAAPKKQDVQNAIEYLNVMTSALHSNDVPTPIKNTLVLCLYGNPLGKIGESVDKLIAKNADKIHRDKPNEVLEALALVCGYRPQAKPAAKGN